MRACPGILPGPWPIHGQEIGLTRSRWDLRRSTLWLLLGGLIMGLWAVAMAPSYGSQVEVDLQPPEKARDAIGIAEAKEAYRLLVPMPLQASDETRLRQQIQRAIDSSQAASRPLVVLEFVANTRTKQEDANEASAVGGGTEFERSLSLARWLIGPEGVRARTVAYLPRSIEGHAVLIALACEDMAMAPLSEIGRAAKDDSAIDPLVVESYVSIARRRGWFPEAAVRSMLDREASLHRVELVGEKIEFVDEMRLKLWQESGKVLSETQLSIPGQLGSFVGQEARAWQWIAHVPRDDEHLRELLNVSSWKSLKRQVGEGPMRVAVIELRGAISPTVARRWLRVIDEAIEKDKANVLVFHLDSPGGHLESSVQLAYRLADIDDASISTIVWVDGQARGDAALIGLAADSLVMKPQAILGGPGEASINAETVRSRIEDWQRLAEKTERTPGEIYGLLSSDIELTEYFSDQGVTEMGDTVLFSQRPDFLKWKPGKVWTFPEGMSAEEAKERNWADRLAPNLNAVGLDLGIEKLPEPRRVTPLEQWIRQLADQEWLAAILLTLALSLFTNELATPGVGIAGFFAMLCMLLFFWMRFLNGTVEWLEIVMCLGGVFALAIELFVLPGFGIFGVGGFLMLLAGIVLASQTFIVPTNEYQWSKLATSTTQVAIAMVGFLSTLYLLRNQFEHLPLFRLLKLEPPSQPPVENELSYQQLLGAHGIIAARCAPIGTALIDGNFYEVVAPNLLLEPETHVEVFEVRGKTIWVRPVSSK